MLHGLVESGIHFKHFEKLYHKRYSLRWTRASYVDSRTTASDERQRRQTDVTKHKTRQAGSNRKRTLRLKCGERRGRCGRRAHSRAHGARASRSSDARYISLELRTTKNLAVNTRKRVPASNAAFQESQFYARVARIKR